MDPQKVWPMTSFPLGSVYSLSARKYAFAELTIDENIYSVWGSVKLWAKIFLNSSKWNQVRKVYVSRI